MTMTQFFSAVTSALALLCVVHVTHAECPWEEPGLKLWSSPATWPSGVVPQENDEVLINNVTRVLLDVQPASLTSMFIQGGGALVWGDVDGLTLSTEFIYVEGEFHMGSTNCRFKKKANIKLRGRYYSETQVFDNRKFLAVGYGGSLELHGEKKTPWTRLAQSIKSLDDLGDCPYVYDHADEEANPFAMEKSYSGLQVLVWNPDGSVFDFQVFRPTYSGALNQFISDVPSGHVIAMYARTQLGNRTTTNMAAMDSAINKLGGTLFTQVDLSDMYALITKKGSKSSTREHYKMLGQKSNYQDPEGWLRLPDFDAGLDFQVSMSAKTKFQFFRVVQSKVAYPILELAEDVNWKAGDRVVVASTDYDWRQAEIRALISCPECTKSQIRVEAPFFYRHFGNFTYGVDERAEVGLLSRNIVIEGVMEENCYALANDKHGEKLCRRFGEDTFGGQLKVLEQFKSARIQGVELYHMGQQYLAGRYPLHFHMCGTVKKSVSWFRDNAIHHSFSRCVTIHGTNNSEVSGNVCYDHIGHGFFMEDSVERGNVITNNLCIGTRPGTLLMSDSTKEWCGQDQGRKGFEVNCMELSGFWLTHPDNIFSGNSAAGGDGHGIMLVMSETALTSSWEKAKTNGQQDGTAKHYPLKEFYNNVAHSNKASGVFIDSLISSGRFEWEEGVPENGIIQTENSYDPRDPPGDPNGVRVWTTIDRMTAYKNVGKNLWIKGGNINITFSSVADSPEGLSGGTTGTDTGVSMEYSVFVGRSENLGNPQTYNQKLDDGTTLKHNFEGSFPGNPWKTITGVSLYQGPMFVKHSHFDRFFTSYWNDSWTATLGERPTTLGGAVSFKRDSTYPMYNTQFTTDLSFGFCENSTQPWVFHGTPDMYDWDDRDGTRAAFNIDRDGSLTNYPGSFIIKKHPFLAGPSCLWREDWGMNVCPYRYIKMEIFGVKGSLTEPTKSQYPIVVYRDDGNPRIPFLMEGEVRREWALRTHKSYLINFNASAPEALYPEIFNIFSYGVDAEDVVRVGLCLPGGVTDIDIRSDYPEPLRGKNYTLATSLAALDADTDKTKNKFFLDTANGILFFKIFSPLDRTNETQQCAEGKCWGVRIILKDGDLTDIRDCSAATYDTFDDGWTEPQNTPSIPACQGPASSEGLGAIRWDEVTKIVDTEFDVTCLNPQPDTAGVNGPETSGTCYVYKFVDDLKLKQEFGKSMTREWCLTRCYQRMFEFAAVSYGKRCQCTHAVNLNDPVKAVRLGTKTCNTACSGNSDQKCGNGGRVEIIATGR